MVRTRRPLLALLALLALLTIGYGVKAADDGGSGSSPGRPQHVAEAALPAAAQRTITLIERHGPFPYTRDGIVFRNDEHELPSESRGYYHEYTVRTPGASDRGARRIIAGEDGQFYYTDDHYASFERVDPSG